jgi:predicted nucleotidyltransferase
MMASADRNIANLIQNRHAQLHDVCRARHVRRLAVFGSGAADRFDPSSSDLDFLVEFERMPPAERAEHYFGLIDDLQQLFGVPVELVEPGGIQNPYFRRAIEETQVELYVAA